MGKTLTERLQKLKDQQQGIFVPYIMAGDHEKGLAGLQETIQFLEELGVSAIEVGIPFSDPVADGPVIEEAGLRSLAMGRRQRVWCKRSSVWRQVFLWSS